MSRKTGLYLDSSEFDKKFYDLVENAIPDDARDGLFKAMNEVLRDFMIAPNIGSRECLIANSFLFSWNLLKYKPLRLIYS